MIVAYDGSRFNGFQRQITNADMQQQRNQTFVVPKRPHWDTSNGCKKKKKQTATSTTTIQECIEDAISLWTLQTVQDIGLRLAGRTDKGVHARGQVITVNLQVPPPPQQNDTGVDNDESTVLLPTWEIQNSINSRLPTDISIVEVQPIIISDDSQQRFDPRRDVVCKQYSYTIKFRRKVYCNNSGMLLPICQAGPNSFRHALDSSCLWVVPWPLDDSLFQRLCRFLQGRHNFVAFVHKHNRSTNDDDNYNNHELTLDKMQYDILSETNEEAPVVTARLCFESKGFRRSMVRNLVGFCVDMGRGVAEVADWNELWTEQAASKIHAAPACGLCLEWVKYWKTMHVSTSTARSLTSPSHS